jgi:DUF1016 N-terminal domain
MTKDLRKAVEVNEGASQLLHSLRGLIQNARQRALRAVDAVQVQTCWEIGRHIVEFEQGGSARAEYGARLLQTLAASLAAEFGRGFDVSNLRYMRLFYNAFPIRDALRHELSWTHPLLTTCQLREDLKTPVGSGRVPGCLWLRSRQQGGRTLPEAVRNKEC